MSHKGVDMVTVFVNHPCNSSLASELVKNLRDSGRIGCPSWLAEENLEPDLLSEFPRMSSTTVTNNWKARSTHGGRA
jgi:hypothetical protein